MTQSNVNPNGARRKLKQKVSKSNRLVKALIIVAVYGFLYLCSEFDDIKQGYLDARDGKAYIYTP